jgi:hypothetical protein
LLERSFSILSQETLQNKRKLNVNLKSKKTTLKLSQRTLVLDLQLSADYRILWANKLMKQLNGDCEGKACYSTFNKLTAVCPNCGVKKVFENDVPLDIHEYSNLDDKGNRFWIELIVTPIKDSARE